MQRWNGQFELICTPTNPTDSFWRTRKKYYMILLKAQPGIPKTTIIIDVKDFFKTG